MKSKEMFDCFTRNFQMFKSFSQNIQPYSSWFYRGGNVKVFVKPTSNKLYNFRETVPSFKAKKILDFLFQYTGLTIRVEFNAEPHSVGDERVVCDVLGQKVVVLFGFDGQQLSICQQRENFEGIATCTALLRSHHSISVRLRSGL